MSDMHFREPNQVKWSGVRPAHNGVQVLESGMANNATVILYTVPATEILYLCGFTFVSWTTIFSSDGYLQIYDDGALLWRELAQGAAGINQAMSMAHGYWPPIEVRADYTINLVSTAATTVCFACINGWAE